MTPDSPQGPTANANPPEGAALVARPKHPKHPKRMTRAKAERLVDALEAVLDCEDGPSGPEFDDVRAAVERWLD